MMSHNKGDCHAVDDLCSALDTLDVGAGKRLYDWRLYSCPAGYRNRYGVDQDHPGTKTSVIDL